MDKLELFSGLFISQECDFTTRQTAVSLAEKYKITILNRLPTAGLFLNADQQGIGLCDSSKLQQAPVKAEFTSTEMAHRLKSSGARSEFIMRAIGNKQANWHVIDATPGLGRDAMVMATFGCCVTMVERSPIVSFLLDDGLRNLRANSPDVFARLSLFTADSIEFLSQSKLSAFKAQVPEVVYLDPMFPHRKKSALVKKEMQLFQRLLGNDQDADSLLSQALQVATKRVVVKRPNTAEPLNMQKPDTVIKSKKHRFDVYLMH